MTLQDAGHILGSAFVTLRLTERERSVSVVVSGDLGQPGRPIVRDPDPRPDSDVLLLESTYGDRDHPPMQQTLDALATILRQALGESQASCSSRPSRLAARRTCCTTSTG